MYLHVMAKATATLPPEVANGRDAERILAQHGRWLRTILLARLRDPQAVEEVLQEVSLALVRGRSLPARAADVPPWLYRVAIRQVLLYRRKAGRRRNFQERFVVDQPPLDHDPQSPNPLAWLLAEERQRLVRTALRHLPPRDAEMLLLKYTEDWNYQQIADHLGLTHAAVESRLHRARARLRQELVRLNVIEPAARSA
jgi:RNA polymerase sigma-70 factor (ECF subfamily)